MVQQNEHSKRNVPPSKTVAIGLKLNKDYYKKRYNTGHRLFLRFQRVNLLCSWSCQQLQSSIKSMNFVGFLIPHTLLVSGSLQQMDIIKQAWNSHLLQAPDGFQIIYFGEISAFQIDLVKSEATKSSHLLALLCSIVLQLNRADTPATVSTIKTELKHHCQRQHTTTPTDQIVFEMLNSLLSDGKLSLAGSGYYVTRDSHLERILTRFNNPKETAESVSSQKKNSPFKAQSKLIHHKNKLVSKSELNLERAGNKLRGRTGTMRKLFTGRTHQRKSGIHKQDLPARSSSGCSSISSCHSDEEEITPRLIDGDDSLAVNCGEKLHRKPVDERVESDEGIGDGDANPAGKHKSMKDQRCLATTHLRQKPLPTPVESSLETCSDTEYCAIPTANMYFDRKKALEAKLTRNSTVLPLSKGVTDMSLPNISSISLCDQTFTANLTESTNFTCGEDNSKPTHSTPAGEQTVPSIRFSVTGHSQSTEAIKKSSDAYSISSKVSEKFCDCETVLHCGCSTIASSKLYSRRDVLVQNNLKYLCSL